MPVRKAWGTAASSQAGILQLRADLPSVVSLPRCSISELIVIMTISSEIEHRGRDTTEGRSARNCKIPACDDAAVPQAFRTGITKVYTRTAIPCDCGGAG